MALSETEKANVRLYLGYADQYRFHNTRLESVFTNLTAESETLARDLLTKLAQIDEYIDTAAKDGTGNLKKVGEIEFHPNAWGSETSVAFRQSRSYGRRLIARLSIIFGVPVYGDYYGGEGWPGDSFFGSNGGVGGSGGPPRLG